MYQLLGRRCCCKSAALSQADDYRAEAEQQQQVQGKPCPDPASRPGGAGVEVIVKGPAVRRKATRTRWAKMPRGSVDELGENAKNHGSLDVLDDYRGSGHRLELFSVGVVEGFRIYGRFP